MASACPDQLPPPPALWSLQSARFHMMILLGGLAMMFSWTRGSISMVIVCMIMRAEASALTINATTTEEFIWHRIFLNNDLYGISWSAAEQSFIHASHFFGAFLGLFASHFLIKRFHAKRVLTFGLLVNSIGSFLTPLIAITAPYWTTAILRGIMGFGNGFLIPCSITIVRKWFPRTEANTAIATLLIGNQFGIACSMLFTSVIGRIDLLGGWTIAVTLYGLAGIAFVVLWETHAANKPRHSSYVTATELDYIRGKRLKRSMINKDDVRTPYKKILLSPSIVAICSSSYTHSFIVSSIVAYLPIFNLVVMHKNLLQNGIESSLPFLVQSVSTIASHFTFMFIKRRNVSATTIVRAFSTLGTCCSSACIFALIVSGTDHGILLTLIQSITLGFLSASSVAYTMSACAVAPQFTLFTLSYTEMYAHLAGALSTLIAGLLWSNGALKQRSALLSLLALVLSSGLLFLLLGHGRREVFVKHFSRHSSRTRRWVSSDTQSPEETMPPAHQSESSVDDPNPEIVVYGEGEASILLRHEDLQEDLYEDLTSDDEY